jgi:hypothetical protein
MCITNDDATRNGKKHNDVTKKKENAWRRKRKTEREGNDEKVVTIEENKETKDEKKTKVTTKMKEKNDKKKNI